MRSKRKEKWKIFNLTKNYLKLFHIIPVYLIKKKNFKDRGIKSNTWENVAEELNLEDGMLLIIFFKIQVQF